MLSQLYGISFWVSWRMERKQNPLINKLSSLTKTLIHNQLDIKLRRPLFSKMMDPDVGNLCIQKLHARLENFKYEDQCIRVNMRDSFPIEGFAVESKGNSVIGQYLLHFNIFNKGKESAAENYDFVTPILLKEIGKIIVETNDVFLEITDYRVYGQVKQHSELWPNGSTLF